MTERIEIRTNPGPPSADRDMTFDEKRKLSVFISSIDGDKLGQVLEIITQEEPDLPGMLCIPSYMHSFFASLIHSSPQFIHSSVRPLFYPCMHTAIHSSTHSFVMPLSPSQLMRTVLHVSSSLYEVLSGQFLAMSNGY